MDSSGTPGSLTVGFPAASLSTQSGFQSGVVMRLGSIPKSVSEPAASSQADQLPRFCPVANERRSQVDAIKVKALAALLKLGTSSSSVTWAPRLLATTNSGNQVVSFARLGQEPVEIDVLWLS